MKRARHRSKISLRIYLEDDVAIGPGKADLLEAIRATGTIAEAGRRLDMSYKRAWMLVETMNRCFRSPLVETSKGGAARGGATLTALGADVLERYRTMEATAQKAVRDNMIRFKALLAR